MIRVYAFARATLIIALMVVPALAQSTSDALHQAVIKGDFEQVRQLVVGGADVNAKDPAGFTPLFYAAQEGNVQICNFLAENGANVNIKDQYGNTPLHYAAVKGHAPVCNVLLNKGADPTAQNLTGGTPLAMAQAGGNQQVIQLLSGQARPMNRLGPPDMSRPMMPQPRQVQLSDIYRNDQSDPNFPDPIRDPNEVKAKVKTYEGLEKELEQVDQRSRSEIRCWMEDSATNIDLARAIHRQIRGEMDLFKDIAEKENAKNTITAIDDVGRNRSTRYARMIRELQKQEQENSRSVAGTGTRGRSRNTGGSAYNTRSRSRTRDTRETLRSTHSTRRTRESEVTTPATPTVPVEEGPDPDLFKLEFKPIEGFNTQALILTEKAEEEMWEWLDSTTATKNDMFSPVSNQRQKEMTYIRMVAEKEGAKKTVAAMDGMMVLRRERYLAMMQEMQERAANPQQMEDQQGMRRGRTGRSSWGHVGSSVSGGPNPQEPTRGRR